MIILLVARRCSSRQWCDLVAVHEDSCESEPVEDDTAKASRTARDWVVTGVVDVTGYVVIALLLRIWLPWEDALLWALVAIAGWVGTDIIGDVRRRRRSKNV